MASNLLAMCSQCDPHNMFADWHSFYRGFLDVEAAPIPANSIGTLKPSPVQASGQ